MDINHLIDLNDFSKSQWGKIISVALEIEKDPAKYYGKCAGKILATLFYEPSTRTQMSFQTAMLKLGGQIIGFDNPQNSSVSKGESLNDTIKIISSYADVIAIRHPLEGAAKAASAVSSCPVINAGDGGHLHPTQTLTDLVTLSKYKGSINNLTVGFCGDLKFGRTVHSLIKALCCFDNIKFVLISTPELSVPAYISDLLDSHGCEYKKVASLSKAIPELDVLYMTRVQKERFSSEDEYNRLKNVYILDSGKLLNAKKDLCVLHPLPRVDEISHDIDGDSRAKYFNQAQCGVYARMALIMYMLYEQAKPSQIFTSRPTEIYKCENPKCITNSEKLPGHFKKRGDLLVCEYCDERILI